MICEQIAPVQGATQRSTRNRLLGRGGRAGTRKKKKLTDKKAGRLIRNSAISVRVSVRIWAKLRIRTGVKIRIRTRTRIRTRIGTRPRAQARVMLYMNTDRARTALTESSRR